MRKGVTDKMKLIQKKFKYHRNSARWTCTYINNISLQLTSKIVTSYLKHQTTDKLQQAQQILTVNLLSYHWDLFLVITSNYNPWVH